ARAKLGEHLPEAVFFAHGVGVHALDAGAREHAHDGLLDALGARALPADVGRGAGRTAVGRAAFVAAKVAAQHLVLAVIGHAHAAMRALLDVAALAALHRGRVAAA